MGKYMIDGPWLECRLKELIADLRRVNKMIEMLEVDNGNDPLVLQRKKLLLKSSVFKEVLRHATYVETKQKEGGRDG